MVRGAAAERHPTRRSAARYYTIDFPNRAVGVVVRRGGEFLLIRQYRFIVDEHVWAIPSGGVEDGESIVDGLSLTPLLLVLLREGLASGEQAPWAGSASSGT